MRCKKAAPIGRLLLQSDLVRPQECALALGSEIFGRRLSVTTGHKLVLYGLPFIKALQACLPDSGNMHKDILGAVLRLDKTKSLGGIEPFHGTSCHADLLCLIGRPLVGDKLG